MFKSIFTSQRLGARSTAQFAAVVAAGAISLGLVATTAQSGLDAIATNTAPTTITPGKLEINLAGGPAGSGFTKNLSSLAPGDTRSFYVDLTNGELEAQKLSLSVAESANNALTRDATRGVAVKVSQCSAPWSSGTCSAPATETLLLAESPITEINSAIAATNVKTLINGAINSNEVMYFKFTLKLPDQDEVVTNGVLPAGSIQSLTNNLTWSLRAIQRNATSADL